MSTFRMCARCGGRFAGTFALCPADNAPLFAPEVVARIGMKLKDHEILDVIGEGGMGVVYRAQHVVLEKPVAIKVLHDRFAKQTESIEQFLVEAKAASRIRHPNIIDVTDIGTTDEGLVFMVMEFLEGENLEDRLHKVGRLSVFDAVNILRQVARGLGAAHELGIIHRDLKPANIFLVSREGRRRVVRRLADDDAIQFKVEPEGNYDVAKLLDFGVAKFLNLGPSAATRAGVVCGTPYYLSPEQAQEQPADARSDIYSLGAVFYEMITGAVPFTGNSLLEILTGHVTGTVVPPSERAPEAGIDPHTDAVVLKCLAKEPGKRFATAEELGDALRDCVGDRAFLRDAERLPGIRESGFELPRKHPELANTRRFRQTRRIRRDRGPGRTVLAVLAGLVCVVGGVLALRHLRAPSAAVLANASHAAVVAVPKPRPKDPPPNLPPPGTPPPTVAPAAATEVPHVVPVGLASPMSRPAGDAKPAGKPNSGIERILQRASAMPSMAPPSSTASPAPHPAPSAAPGAAAAPPAAHAVAEAEAMVREAQQAWVRQHYALAIARARDALVIAPDQPLAHQIIALCSCGLHKSEDANLAMAHLDPAKQRLVRTLCQKDGVTLDPE